MKKQRHKSRSVLLLVVLLFIFIALNYSFLNHLTQNLLDERETAHVTRIIDGDTIETNRTNETSIRLLGINTPEKGEFLYQQAKDFLSKQVLNKTVVLEFTKDKTDKYGRTLAYVFLDGENINVKMVENGFANYYFYSGRDKYYSDLLQAWASCIINSTGLCERSEDQCAKCIKISSESTITNSCILSCNIKNWTIETEGREKNTFNQTLNPAADAEFSLDLANSGGTVFLRDNEGKLVTWKVF